MADTQWDKTKIRSTGSLLVRAQLHRPARQEGDGRLEGRDVTN